MKEALRNRVDQDFDKVVMECRRLEEEYSGSKNVAHSTSTVQQQAQQPDRIELLLQKMLALEKKVEDMEKQKLSQGRQGQHTETPSCYKCKKVGHLLFGCRDGQDVTCYRCNEKGHISASCLN